MRASALSSSVCPEIQLRKVRLGEPIGALDGLHAQSREPPLKFGRAGRRIAEATPGPIDKQFGNGAPMGHPMLSAEYLEGLRRRQRGSGVAAPELEREFGLERMGHRRSVAEISRAAIHRLDQFAGAFDLAQLPHRYREPRHRGQAGVLAEAFARLPIALKTAGGESPLAMCSRLRKFAERKADYRKAATGDANFHDASQPLRLLQERRRELARRLEFASDERQGPLTVGRREALGKVVGIGRKLGRAREGGLGFVGGEALGVHHRLAIVGLKLQTLARGGASVSRSMPRRCGVRLVRHGDRLAEMGDRLLKRRAAERLVARLAPPFDSEIVEAGLGEMPSDELRLGRRALGLVAQNLRGAAVQRLAAALEQALVCRILDQRVLEAIGRPRRRALDDEEVGLGEPVERGLQAAVVDRRLQLAKARRKNRARARRRSARSRALRRDGRAAPRATAEVSVGSPARRPRPRARARAA